MKRLKVLFTTNIPSPYRVDFFNELGKYCDLTVTFEKAYSDERDEKWKKFHFLNFKGIVLKGKPVDVDKAFCLEIIKYVRDRSFDFIVMADTVTPTGILAILYMKLFHMKYFLEADGGFVKSESFVKRKFKTFLMGKAAGYFSSSKSLDFYFRQYGANEKRIFRYPFTSVFDYDVQKRVSTYDEKVFYRRKLGATEDKIVISVGQFIYRKGFDILLNEWSKIDEWVGLYLIGGVPTDEYKEIVRKNQLKHVHFVEFKKNEELKFYYKMADLFVLPTREDIWGLVINEAFAYGLPVITTDKCIAGLEMVENAANGYIVPLGNNNLLIKKITDILEDDHKRLDMAANAILTAKKYTIEKMAMVHMDTIKKEVGTNHKEYKKNR